MADEVLLNKKYSFGATGGPMFRTTIFQSASGFEKRNIDWEEERNRYNISYVKTKTDYDELKSVFYAARARGYSFLFWAEDDHELIRQQIGSTDSVTTVFQVYKRYTNTVRNYDRDITRIAAGTYTVWVNGIQATEGAGAGEYQLDTATGLLTLGATLGNIGDSPPTVETIEIAITEFYIPMRFDDDEWQGTIIDGTQGNNRIYSVNLNLIEDKE